MARQIWKATQSTHAADRVADILPMLQSKTSAWENIPACFMEENGQFKSGIVNSQHICWANLVSNITAQYKHPFNL
jgi:hypothetical protein